MSRTDVLDPHADLQPGSLASCSPVPLAYFHVRGLLSPDAPLVPGRSTESGHGCLSCGPSSRWAVVLVALPVLGGDAVPLDPEPPCPPSGLLGFFKAQAGLRMCSREKTACALGAGMPEVTCVLLEASLVRPAQPHGPRGPARLCLCSLWVTEGTDVELGDSLVPRNCRHQGGRVRCWLTNPQPPLLTCEGLPCGDPARWGSRGLLTAVSRLCRR